MGTSTALSSPAGRAVASPGTAPRVHWLRRLKQHFARWSHGTDRALRDLAELYALAARCERHSPNLANELRYFATRHADDSCASPHRMGSPHR